jgi:type III pantothenate kinase
MTVRIVADIGNSRRIKWGLLDGHEIRIGVVTAEDSDDWQEQLREWEIDGPAEWAIAGVHPTRRDRLVEWAKARGDAVRVIADYRDLPIAVDLPAPDKVGIDRLLNAVAALARVPRGTPIVIVDAGSAVTVDLVDRAGVFRGGAIFPGLHLMARALHEFTALLPQVEDFGPHEVPGRDTVAAIRAGVFHAVCGGIDRLVEQMADDATQVLLTGGDADLLAGLRCRPKHVGAALTLEGIRRTAWPEPS